MISAHKDTTPIDVLHIKITPDLLRDAATRIESKAKVTDRPEITFDFAPGVRFYYKVEKQNGLNKIEENEVEKENAREILTN